MLDVRWIRENREVVEKALEKRGAKADVDGLISLDERRRAILKEAEELKNTRNTISKEVGVLKREGKDATHIMNQMGDMGERIKVLDQELREVEEGIKTIQLDIPNIPHETVPVGATENDFRLEKTVGTPREFSFPVLAHWDLGENLDILDFERATKITGARFTIYKGMAARLERALINLMLNTHTKNEYQEIMPPFMVNGNSMIGTGQLPKFAEDMFKLEKTDYYLVPTAEVPVTNIFRDEILEEKSLPISYCAYTPCFRAEAGSYGRDTRGIIRQHQFNKVELVKFAHPEDSYEQLEKLTLSAESILEMLELPYRRITLSTGDIGFSSAKTYDLEVWLPSFAGYREISSCSNFEDFQARRANIRFRGQDGKVRFVHTLNGSGLAVGRTTAAIMENYQNEDGSITVPKALVHYMGGVERITK